MKGFPYHSNLNRVSSFTATQYTLKLRMVQGDAVALGILLHLTNSASSVSSRVAVSSPLKWHNYGIIEKKMETTT